MAEHPLWCAPILCQASTDGPHMSQAYPAADIVTEPRSVDEPAVLARLVQQPGWPAFIRLRIRPGGGTCDHDFDLDLTYAAKAGQLLSRLAGEAL